MDVNLFVQVKMYIMNIPWTMSMYLPIMGQYREKTNILWTMSIYLSNLGQYSEKMSNKKSF